MNFNNMSIWLLVAIFIAGAVAGAWGMHTWTEDIRTQLQVEKNKPPQVKETVKTETKTQLQYVPGETVYIPVPGQPNAPPVATKLDGKFEIAKPDFVFTVNGKPGKFTKADDEKYVFDKNMIALTQTSIVRIEAEIPTVDLTRRNAIGPYITTESYGLLASRETNSQRILLMGGKKWDNKNGRGYEAGGAWQFKF